MLIVAIGGNALFFQGFSWPERGVLGGPATPTALAGEAEAALAGHPLIPQEASLSSVDGFVSASDPGLAVGALVAQDVAGFSSGQASIVTYVVKTGDSLSRIAERFGVSIQTIIGSNPGVKNRRLVAGQSLTIPTVSGAIYRVRPGETPTVVAERFNIPLAQLKEFNKLVDFDNFEPGSTVIIPGVVPLGESDYVASSDLLDLKDYFMMPTDGFNWGRLHSQNAVDIAANCGTLVRAAAEGLVVDQSDDDWSFGYGRFLTIEHSNGTRSRYAHLASAAASIGDYVRQGQVIAKMGNTGNVHGPTGCHLHFEVYGARNPFVRAPL